MESIFKNNFHKGTSWVNIVLEDHTTEIGI